METLPGSLNPANKNYELIEMNAKYKYFMCRLCLCKSGTLSDIHGCKVGSGLVAAAVVYDLLRLEVSVTDGYPQLVCLVCLKKLYDFQRFKDSCWKAKANFETLYYDRASPDNVGPGGMCSGGASTMVNDGDYMESNMECSNPCPEEYMEERKYIPEIDIKETPVEESIMRDPLRVESPYNDKQERDIGEEADITIKEEEIQINEIQSFDEAPVTFVENMGKITEAQGKSNIEKEDTQGPMWVKQPESSSTKDICEENSSTKGTENDSNQVISKPLEENNLLNKIAGPSESNNALSQRMILFPVGLLVKLNSQGQIQNNNQQGVSAQNGRDDMHMRVQGGISTADGKKIGEESKSSAVNITEVGGDGKNNAVDRMGMGKKESEKLIGDGIKVGESKGNTPEVDHFCNICCQPFSSMSDLVSHNCAVQVGEDFECKECGKKFAEERIFWNHLRKHNTNKHFFCQVCGRGFLKEENLTMHLHSHTINIPRPPVVSRPVYTIVSGEEQMQMSCDQLKIVSSRAVDTGSEKEQAENESSKSKAGNVCPVCGRVYSTLWTLKRHVLQQHSEKKFGCNYCSRKFRTERGAECHSRKHRENRPYRCEVCGVGFFKEDYMLKHVSNHARDLPFQCDRCGKTFRHKKPLWTHIPRCYKTKRYQCNICYKKFHSEKYLAVHKTIHTGEKNLMCEVCGRTFRGLATLTVHRRQHTGEKPYHCDICDKRFTQRHSFKTHNKRYHE